MSLLFFICQNLAGGVFADCNLIVIEYKLYTKTLDSYSSMPTRLALSGFQDLNKIMSGSKESG